MLANQYRPTKLSEVVGQQQAIEVVQSIIDKGVPRGAYLFSGTSGSGKTTCARIVANSSDFGEVFEVNASADNGVEGTRELKETLAKQRFSNARLCVILDEAHMYTSAAWASLLKTIEEPEHNAVIIFCTTDPQKMPRTITSRCVQVQFSEIPEDEIVKRLIEVIHLEREKGNEIKASKKGLQLIAQSSHGSVRRALFALEECCGDATYEKVKTLPGIVAGAEHDAILAAIMEIEASGEQAVAEALVDYYNKSGDEALREVLTEAINKACVEQTIKPNLVEKLVDARVLMTKIPVDAAIRAALYI